MITEIELIAIIYQLNKFIINIENHFKKVINVNELANFLISTGNHESITEEKIIIMITDSTFIKNCKGFSDLIILDKSILPSFIETNINKKHFRFKGEIWVIHNNDSDPYPSTPHAHNYEENISMHLGNGSLYRKRKQIGKLSKSDFISFRKLIKNIAIPPLEN